MQRYGADFNSQKISEKKYNILSTISIFVKYARFHHIDEAKDSQNPARLQ